MLQYVVVLGALAQLIGISSYIKDTVQGKTKPNRVTWLLWAVNGFIAAGAAYVDGVEWAVLPVFMTGFATFLVFLASFVNSKAYWELKLFDYLCGFCSIIALVLWALTQEPLIAIILAIISDVFATAPTVKKAWQHPETESLSAYIAGAFNALTAFFALKIFTTSELAFPIYNVIVNSIVILAIYRYKLKQKLSNH